MVKVSHLTAQWQKCLFLLLVLVMFYGIAKAQTPEPFTLTVETKDENSTIYTCKQNHEKEGFRVELSDGVFSMNGKEIEAGMFLYFELNLSKAIDDEYRDEFPTGSGLVHFALEFEDGTRLHKTVNVEKSGQLVKFKDTNLNNFSDTKQSKLDAHTTLSIIAKHNISELSIIVNGNYGLDMWVWKLNTFKTAPTIKAMIQRINAEMEKSKGKITQPNKLSQGAWRTHMNKVMDHVPGWYFENMLYRGQETNVGYYITASHGLGVNKWPDGTFYWGDWKNGDQHGYGILICPKGRVVTKCSNCVYYVGNWRNDIKEGKGTCYDEYGNLIYYGDFSSDRPTGTYPSTGSYSSYKFECIEYDNGNKYVGETKDGKRHGRGIYLWKNGDAWYGPWQNGIRDGYGMLLHYDGTITYGRWLNDSYYRY